MPPKPTSPAGTIDAIPVPDDMTDPAEVAVFKRGAEAGLCVGYERGQSAGRKEGHDMAWRKP